MIREDASSVLDSIHRINNKLTGIMGITELLLKDWDLRDDDGKRHIMRMINDSALGISNETWSIWNKVAKYENRHCGFKERMKT